MTYQIKINIQFYNISKNIKSRMSSHQPCIYKGIKKCGLYHGVVRITACVTIETVSVPAKKIDIMEYQ